MLASITAGDLVRELKRFNPHQKIRFMFIDSEDEDGMCTSYTIQEVGQIELVEGKEEAILLISHEECVEEIVPDFFLN